MTKESPQNISTKDQLFLGWRRSAGVNSLQELKDVTLEDAKKIKHIWRTQTGLRRAREAVAKVFGTDVEYLGVHKRHGFDVYYCNGGDFYASTILFLNYNLTVGCVADIIEKGLISNDSPY